MSTKQSEGPGKAPRGPLGGLVKKFLDMNLAAKFSLMFSVIVLTVLIFTTLVLADSGQRYLQAEQDARCKQSLEFVRILIEKEQRYMEGLTEYYASSTETQELLALSNAGQPVPEERTQDLLESTRFKMYLLSVVFYNLEGEPIDYVSIDNSHDPLPQSGQSRERPFERLMNSYRDAEWEYIPQYSEVFMEMDHSSKLVLWTKIEDRNTRRAIGAVAVSLDVRKLIGSEVDSDAPQNSLLLSRSGDIALNRSGYELPDRLVDQLCESAGQVPSVYEYSFDGQDCNIYYQSCSGTPFISCVIEPDSASFWTETSVLRSALLIISIFLLAMLVLARIFVAMLSRPLNKLSESMVRFSKGDYSARADFRYGDDIGRLSNVFNNMVEENRRLVDLNYVLKLREKEAELSILQMQINPHFLYNILHTAYWCALKNHDKPTADIMYSLSQFFRLSLNRGSELMSVRNCLGLVRCYLELQQHRFGSRLSWSIDSAPEMNEVLMPKLILQPIVENCIVHGMDSGDTAFVINVKAEISDDRSRLSFLIEDNGVGIPPGLLEFWPDRMEEYFRWSGQPDGSDGQRIALRNIYERLRIRYGDRFSFEIKNRAGGGTSVCLTLPNDYKEA